MGARTVALTPDERALLDLLDRHGCSGQELLHRSGFPPERFTAATHQLWRVAMLQGVPAEGCCQDPCGINCVAAFDLSGTWTVAEG